MHWSHWSERLNSIGMTYFLQKQVQCFTRDDVRVGKTKSKLYLCNLQGSSDVYQRKK